MLLALCNNLVFLVEGDKILGKDWFQHIIDVKLCSFALASLLKSNVYLKCMVNASYLNISLHCSFLLMGIKGPEKTMKIWGERGAALGLGLAEWKS